MSAQVTPYTERDMLNLLLNRYSKVRRGTIADRFVRAEHVRVTQDWRKITRIADFVAIDKYASSQSLIGHEVKVSRSDWLTELRDKTKADEVKRYCNYWYLVVSDQGIARVEEIPDDWGLMVKSGDGLRVKKKAPLLNPEPLTLDFVAGLASAVQRTAFREPLYRSASSVWVNGSSRGYTGAIRVCQACGQESPCSLHQVVP